jgi:hypothetical protein
MQKESTAAILAISQLVFPRGKSSSGPELRLRKQTLNQLPGILLKLSRNNILGIMLGRFYPAKLYNYSQQLPYRVSVVEHLSISRILFIIADSAPNL